QGEEHIRSVHLLGALTENPHLVRCDGLWPLLTLSQSQLQRLSPLLDAQSDECPEDLLDAEPVPLQGDRVEFVGRPVDADTTAIQSGDLPPVLLSALDKFTRDITASAREGKIDPVSGRDTEIRQMVDI
ncbi:type VI secretion system ATPase TssH, partial [Escherichia coli]|nr:type VI secretion system ATPase TssH [Escherichia coli]